MPPIAVAPKPRRAVTLACSLALLVSLFLALAVLAQSAPPCKDQSPRRLENYDAESRTSAVIPGPPDTLIYTPHGGAATTLHRCGQHYHCWIENLQPACPGQHATPAGGPAGGCPKLPPVGSWVEIHTVYSSVVAHEGCDPETLDCCKAGPFVVKGYHAKVTANPVPGPVPVLWTSPQAQWSGSNTGPDNPPGSCKPLQAFWDFNLRCDMLVGENQLAKFHHQDQARGLQPPDRLSHDLTRVDPKGPHHP